MDYQWYPGHMTRARRQMQEEIKLIDLVIELIDARAPASTRNPDIDVLAAGKGRIVLLNKSDLASQQANQAWEQYYREQGLQCACINARDRDGLKQLRALVREACREKIERDRRRGIINRPVRAMVAGIPNVGKSTFINSVAGKSAAKTGDKPGVTKGKQWIRLAKDLEFLDTPGILWPKFEDQQIGLRLAMLGSIRDEILQTEELAQALLEYLAAFDPSLIHARYFNSEENSRDTYTLREIAIARGCLMKGGEVDESRASRLVLDDFRSGKLGRITLEMPPQ